MPFVRAIARPMLASVFIVDGLDALRNPKSRVAAAEPVYAPLVERVPQLSSTEQVVKLDAAVKVVAGTLLAFGQSPRLSALTLAAGLVPTTTLAAHRFWNEADPAQRSQQRLHFLKNTSALGGLILATVDTAGRPSLGWRARRSPHVIKHAASDLRRDSTLALHDATGAVRYAAADLLHNAKPALHNVADRLQS